jgi:beta-mannosidase
LEQQYLHKGWELEFGEKRLSANVPFSIYYDLMEHNEIEDPFYRDNESEVFHYANEDYLYCLHFQVEPSIYQCQQIYLNLQGVDTLADIYLNDKKVGAAFNMHRQWEFPVKDLLFEQENVLKVRFFSPIKYMKDQIAKRGAIPCNLDTLDGFPYLRKACYMSGWDWAPRLPDMGIVGSVSLIGVGKYRLSDVRVRQQHQQVSGHNQVKLHFEVSVNSEEKDPPVSYQVTVTNPVGEIVVLSNSPSMLVIENPLLWWPNGFGSQYLYEIKIDLLAAGKIVDNWHNKIGLRTMRIAQEPDQWGESFAHEVNGFKIFAMGADYIPEDSLLPRVTRASTKKLLLQCKMANYNTVRVWGGGYYPPDWFYEICDELGLLVWQDFMFTCATYLLTDEFEDNIKKEIIDNVRRIRHHACLAIWCGNNEIEGFLFDGYGETPRLREDYTRIFGYIIPQLMKQEDPDTFYWPSSPSSQGDFDNPHDENRGDAHYWEVWHGYKPFPEYRKHFFRYASEFGFESLPALKTIETFTEATDRNIFSYVMERHQKSKEGYAKMMQYLAQTFLFPKDFSALIYASQLMQAEAMKYAVEHFRRHRGQCMGAIVWQLNDCWPVASWSSIDYLGRLKALHYYEKRFFAPILISCCEEGLLSQDPNPNARPYQVKKSVRFNVANETTAAQELLVTWSLRDSDSHLIGEQKNITLQVPALSSVWMDEVLLDEARLFEDHVYYSCSKDGVILSEGSVIFSLPKFYQYKNPSLTLKLDGDELVVGATAYAKGVEISNEDEDLILSDNYFDMEAGEKRIRVLSGNMKGMRIRSVYEIGF